MNYKQIFLLFKIILGFLIPLILIILPVDYFDTGESVCLSKFLLNVECYACGLTRACMHLIHFDIAGAYYYNTLSFVVLPIISIMWLVWVLKHIKMYKAYQKKQLS